MAKNFKRKQDIKSKLLAAIAMLMVASIMMVSSSYAWFTLSTAPEVQGITTTVGSNGSLEIALAPKQLGGTVGDTAVGSGSSWLEKNLTWGNLLDLSDSAYGLSDIKLLPAQLMVNKGAGTNGANTLPAAPLLTPEYGADGRIEQLLSNTIIGGQREGSTGFYGDGDYGVRAVGTASSMSEQALVLKNNLPNIKNHANKATNAASRSLNLNGGALAAIMVQYAGSTGDNYVAYVPALKALTADLNTSVAELGEMLRSALLVSITTVENTGTFNTLREAIERATVIDADLIEDITPNATLITGFETVAGQVAAIQTKVTAAKQAADALTGDTVTWEQVKAVMDHLMNVNGTITVGGHTIDEIRANQNDYQFLFDLLQNVDVVMGAGSGVYYDIAAVSGNISATVDVNVTAKLPGTDAAQDFNIEDARIRTNFSGATAADGLDTSARGVVAAGGTANSVIDISYAYVVDFVFRTNASGSNLLLQTEGAQRVYGDSQNPATLGKGSTLTYTVDNANVATVRGMMESIFVVFFDTASGDIFAVAGLTVDDATGVIANADGTTTLVGALELRGYDVADNGYVTVGGVNRTNVLCPLNQNQIKTVSAMVYLDGATLSNADMLSSGSAEGVLNLQFASDVDLVPMDNSLKNGEVNNDVTGQKFDATVKVGTLEQKREDALDGGAAYSLDLSTVELNGQPLDLDAIQSVTVTMGGQDITATAWNNETKTISISSVTGDVVVTVTANTSTEPTT